MFCPYLTEDLGKRLVYKSGQYYYYPNREPIPMDTNESAKDLVRKYANRSSTSTRPEEGKKANLTTWENEEGSSIQIPSNSMISINQWEMWSPPEMHYGQEDPNVEIGFGLRRSQQIGDKGKEKASQPSQSQPQEATKSTENTPKAPPPNQKASKNPAPVRKKRPSYPGAWVEGSDDNNSEVSNIPEPVRPIEKEMEKGKKKQEDDEATKVLSVHITDKAQVGGGLRKKIMKQSFTLTLEELLLIAPKFIQELYSFADEESKIINKSQNSGEVNVCNCEDDFEYKKRQLSLEGRKNLTYACPLGFVDITINGRTVKALVDSGAELNIMPEELALQLKLPSREISMNIVGIGGHASPIVGLAEDIPFHIDSEDDKMANFFVVRGKVHTVLGRPFLADHKVRLDLSQDRGEILSYELWDGGRLCIPICSPRIPGWQMAPP
jgi:hypothetical protein